MRERLNLLLAVAIFTIGISLFFVPRLMRILMAEHLWNIIDQGAANRRSRREEPTFPTGKCPPNGPRRPPA